MNSKRSWNYVWFTVPETAKNGQYVKVHVYGESNGIQTEAGNQRYLRVGCEHDDIVADDTDCRHTTYTDYDNGKIKYTDNNDGKTHIWQNGYDRICNTCHEKISVVYGEEHTEKHDYSNGDVCPCSYDRNNCQHTPSKIKTYNRHLFKFLNEKQHETIAIVWNIICSTCEKIYSEEIDYVGDENNPIGLPYDHVWKDGNWTYMTSSVMQPASCRFSLTAPFALCLQISAGKPAAAECIMQKSG